MFTIIISPKAKRELKQLSRYYKKSVTIAIEELKEYPFAGKPLTLDLTKRFAYKIGSYRILYKINEQNKIFYIFTIGHRATVYSK